MSTSLPGEDLRTSPLHAEHQRLGASFAPFAGWLLPLRYSSELEEHRAARAHAGLFDLSHMGEIEVQGASAPVALDGALTGRMSTLECGRARYTMICAADGGVIDDLIAYRQAEDRFLIVANAANTAAVLGALIERSPAGVTVRDRSAEWALIALQGPSARDLGARLLGPDVLAIGSYRFAESHWGSVPIFVARTGYTGEDGFELMVPVEEAPALYRELCAPGPEGAVPAGLAARDSLRLEAGLPLYGHELTSRTTPFDAGLERFVDLDKPAGFVGQAAMVARREASSSPVLVGLVGSGPRSPRAGYSVTSPEGAVVGEVTSGCPSPTLGRPIAMAYVAPQQAAPGTRLCVDVRARLEPVEVVALPFYRRPGIPR